MAASDIGAASGQLFEQRLGLLEVRGIKPFGEPVLDLRQHLLGFFFLALLLPQPAQTHHCPQLPGLGLLPASDLNGLLEGFLWRTKGHWRIEATERMV